MPSLRLELQQQKPSNMPPQLRRYLETCSPDVSVKIWDYLDGDPSAVSEMIDICVIRANNEAHKKPASPPEPCYNQHPMYEQWKGICPKCDGQHARHIFGSREYEVKLQCTNPGCLHIFTLKEGFEAQRQKREGK